MKAAADENVRDETVRYKYDNHLKYNEDGCNHADVTCLEYPGTVIRSLDGWNVVFGGSQPLLVDIDGNSEQDTLLQGLDWDKNTVILTSTGGGGMGRWRMELWSSNICTKRPAQRRI